MLRGIFWFLVIVASSYMVTNAYPAPTPQSVIGFSDGLQVHLIYPDDTVITPTTGIGAIQPAFSPAGRYLSFSEVVGPDGEFGNGVPLVVRDRITGRLETFASDGNNWGPSWSPRGFTLAWSHQSGNYVSAKIVIQPFHGNKDRVRLTDESEEVQELNPCWLDDKTVAYETDRAHIGELPAQFGIWATNVETGEDVCIADFADCSILSPAVLSDGRIAYAIQMSGETFPAVYYKRIGESGVGEPVSSDRCWSPAWDLDGSLIVVSNIDGYETLYRPDLVSGQLGDPIMPGVEARDPAVSPYHRQYDRR